MTPLPRPTPPAVEPAFAVPKQLTHAELQRRIDAGELAPIELEEIELREVSFGEPPSPRRRDELITTSGMPGGWSSAIYADRHGGLWVGVMKSRMHVPPGGRISATRTFETRWRVPMRYRVVGQFSVTE